MSESRGMIRRRSEIPTARSRVGELLQFIENAGTRKSRAHLSVSKQWRNYARYFPRQFNVKLRPQYPVGNAFHKGSVAEHSLNRFSYHLGIINEERRDTGAVHQLCRLLLSARSLKEQPNAIVPGYRQLRNEIGRKGAPIDCDVRRTHDDQLWSMLQLVIARG